MMKFDKRGTPGYQAPHVPRTWRLSYVTELRERADFWQLTRYEILRFTNEARKLFTKRIS